MKRLCDVYIMFYTKDDKSDYEFVSIEEHLECHQDTYRFGQSAVLYKKIDGVYTILD